MNLAASPSMAASALAALLALVATATAASPSPRQLAQDLEAKVRRFRGTMGLYAKNLDTGEILAVDADTRFPTASLIKVAVMVEAYHQLAEGRLRRDATLILKESDKVGDETVPLNVLHAGTMLTVGDLLPLMIAWSDNTATNLLVGLVGTSNVDKRLDAYGLSKTRLYRPTFRDGQADVLPEEEREFGLGSTTPREAAGLMELIAQGRAVDRGSSDDMLSLLAKQQDRAMIPRSLPFEREEILVANKTGWDEEKQPGPTGGKGDVRTDAAYVKSPGARYVIAICARQVQDKRPGVDNEALVLGAELSRMVYDYFNSRPGVTAR